MPDDNRSEKLFYIGFISSVTVGLYLSSFYSYLLFHTLIEITTIAIGFTLFILTWNARKFLTDNFLNLLGIGYFFIALIDLLHTLAYKGMNVFPGLGANLPTQLWIAARSLQAVTLCAAPLFVERRVDNRAIFGIYAAAVSVLLAIVYSGNFPDCYIEGKGLTAFKINSEYVVTAFLLVSLYLFFRKRKYLNDRVFLLTASSIACTAVSEISFTAYLSVYGFANLAGHFSKLAAFYLIYRAVLVTGLKEPFDLIFRDLKQAEQALRKSQDTLEEKVRERTAELRDSEERYRSLIRKVQTAIVLYDGQGRILNSNPLAQELLGRSAEQLLGKALIDLEWHFLREDGSDLPVAEYPANLVLSTRLPLRGHVTGISRPNRDDVAWVLVNAEPEYDDAGEIALVIVSFVDITERKRAEQALHLKAVELEQEVAERQMTQENLQEQALLLENEMDERRKAQDELEKLNMSLEQRVRERTAELEQANVQLQELDRMKSMFIASMSHELRTPLNSVIGFSRILLDEWIGPLNGEQKENLATVLRSGKHLLSLINDVIDVSKIESGTIEAFPEDFDVHDVVSEAVNSFENVVGDKGVELKVQAIHHPMHTDRMRLFQCLLNLLSNAVKYTETGTITVCAELPDGGDMLEISVTDTGIGIREEDLDKLFSPFVRLNSPLKSTAPGAGLGLYLTRKLVKEVLHGDITVKSASGEGSQFVMTLPVNGSRRS